MEEKRISTAIARIEAAAKRIEAASTRAAAPGADTELARRHEALRKEAWAALSEMDSVIGALEP